MGIVRSLQQQLAHLRTNNERFLDYRIISLQKKGTKFQQTTKCQESFDKLEYFLIVAPILRIANPKKEFVVCIYDFLEYLGGVLMQDNLVVSYQSRKVKPRERDYTVYDLELVVMIHALKMWIHYLLGKKFTLVKNYIWLKCFSPTRSSQ